MDIDPFLKVQQQNQESCLICECNFENEKRSELNQSGWVTFQAQAKDWSQMKIPPSDPKYIFTKVFDKITNFTEASGSVHKLCRIQFRTKREIYKKRFGIYESASNSDDKENGTSECTGLNRSGICLRTSIDGTTQKSKVCFICNFKRNSDENQLNQGGLGRCTEDRSAIRVLERLNVYLNDCEHKFFEAAKRLELMLATVHDIFAADVYYHQSCYIKFAINPVKTLESELQIKQLLAENVLNEFLLKVERNILYHKSAFLLINLHKELESVFIEKGLEPLFSSSKYLKQKLIERFNEAIGFFPSGRNIIVYSADVNPCQYSTSFLAGSCLSDQDTIKAFANFIQRKIKASEKNLEQSPKSLQDIELLMKKKPMRELYNAIYATINTTFKTNIEGYAITPSHQLATKIWSIASDWETLLIKDISAKQLVTGMIVHRLTGRKDVVSMLHKMNNSVSYNNILFQNHQLAKYATTSHKAPPTLIKGIATHATLDNNDGKEETNTGKGTTHDTNFTVFQPILKGESYMPHREIMYDSSENDDDITEVSVPEYHIGIKKEPPLFERHVDQEERDLLDLSLKKDVAWAIIEGIENTNKKKI